MAGLFGADTGALAPNHLRTEYLENPLGIDTPVPRFGWWLPAPDDSDAAATEHAVQRAYQVVVATDAAMLTEAPDVWDSGRVESDRTVHVLYGGPPLSPFTRYHWAIRYWDGADRVSDWSAPAWFETAALAPGDFTAVWIRAEAAMAQTYGLRTVADRKAKTATVAIDLGADQALAGLALFPAAPPEEEPDYGFPAAYRLEVASNADFSDAREVLAVKEVEPPAGESVRHDFPPVDARYARFIVEDLARSHAGRFFALAELALLDAQGRNVAVGAPLTCDTSEEAAAWGREKLVDGELKSRTLRSVSPLLRKAFTVRGPVAEARAYASGMGYYELYLNGARVGDHVLDPGNTVEKKRKLYSTFDVTGLLRAGENVAGILLGRGWHGGPPAGWLELRIRYEDGSSESMVTDTTWRANTGPIVENSLFNGEAYDARRERAGWLDPDHDDASWYATELEEEPPAAMSAQAMPPIRVNQSVRPVSVTARGEGVYIVDFGWNLTGWLRLDVAGPRGAEVTLRHAELLYDDGSLNTEPLETAKATDVYVMAGGGPAVYEPRFTQHGFRYAEISGYPGELTADNVTAQVVHTDFEQIGGFDSSNALMNNIFTITLRSILGNSMSIPTDCPNRGERMGWLGDVHLVVEPTLHVFDACAYYENFLRSIADAQNADGTVPDTVPYYLFGEKDGSPAWAVCYPLLTWYLYRYCGDERVVHEHYDNIVRWFATLEAKAQGHLLENAMYGDWLGVEGTPGPVIASSVYYWSARILAEFAHFLERDDDALRFKTRMTEIAAAFNETLYDTEKGCYGNGSQFSQVWPLYLGIVPEARKAPVIAYLRNIIEERDKGHLSTGILGTKYIFDVLCDTDNTALAYTVALQEDYPGWGFMLANGATTLWERWEYKTGNEMNSHNHQMFGSIVGWFFDNVAGLNALPEPGYRRFTIAPLTDPRLDHAAVETQTVAGQMRSAWRRGPEGFTLEATVPPNTRARVVLPPECDPNRASWNGAEPTGAREFNAGPGTHVWVIPTEAPAS
jgi:alpha-L-rhamnosidase